MRRGLFVYVMLGLLVSCSGQQVNFKNYTVSLQILIDSMKVDRKVIEILIDKSDYKLTVLANSRVIKEYPVVFGGNPIDDKLYQGDGCTPEGKFRIKSKYPHSKWSRFMWIDYPTSDSWRKHNLAKQNGTIPAGVGIGGEVGIHGVPNNADFAIDAKMNWTKGCISLKNKDVKEIYEFVDANTLICIQK